eukprot:GHVN01048856.1.p1 GENE.GHVN01048856.1~~GHVN01048856.1.p1  ORF type:complete len:323 (+),score=59.67 GHVN01048856.1:148-1116(+)
MGASPSIESLARKEKKFENWLKNRQADLKGKETSMLADVKEHSKSFYAENKWASADIVVEGSNSQFENSSKFSLENVKKIVDALGKAIFSGGPKISGAKVSEEAGSEALKAAETYGSAGGAMTAASVEFYIAGKVFEVVSSVLEVLGSGGTATSTNQYKTVALGYGLQLFAMTNSSSYQNAAFAKSETIYEVVYAFEVRFCLAQAQTEGQRSLVKQYQDQLNAFETRLSLLTSKLGDGSMEIETYSTVAALWQAQIDKVSKRLQEMKAIELQSQTLLALEKRVADTSDRAIRGSIDEATFISTQLKCEALIDETNSKLVKSI